jgi:hypothetical protein
MNILIKFYQNISYDRLTACGIFIFSLVLYMLISPGRIDIIDGQWRFDVAYNLVHNGSVAVGDPALQYRGLPGVEGQVYGHYLLSGSLIATPLLYLAEFLSPDNRDLAQFLFAMTSPLLSATTLAILYLIYRDLGVSSKSSLFWVFILGFASLFLPLTTSVFDQTQNGLFILISFYSAYLAQRSNSSWVAIVGGIAFIILINYKEAYIVLWPGLLWIAGLNQVRGNIIRQIRENQSVQIYLLSGLLGLAGYFAFNFVRFGAPFAPSSTNHPPIAGDFLAGLIGLTISPGKGLLWYSPVTLLVIFGWRRFLKAVPDLAQGILIAVGIWTVLIASLSFYGGDWCWGPRYWVPVLPLVFLAAPFANWSSKGKRALVTVTIILSFGIQCLAVSVDHQRFFFARELPAFFWYKNYSFYYTESALIARFSELSKLENPTQRKIRSAFRPGPHPESLTYTTFGYSGQQLSGVDWMQQYPVFSLPRPWPIWSLAIAEQNILLTRNFVVKILIFIGAAGLSLILLGLAGENTFQQTRRRLHKLLALIKSNA